MYILKHNYIDWGSYFEVGYRGMWYELVMVDIDYVHFSRKYIDWGSYFKVG